MHVDIAYTHISTKQIHKITPHNKNMHAHMHINMHIHKHMHAQEVASQYLSGIEVGGVQGAVLAPRVHARVQQQREARLDVPLQTSVRTITVFFSKSGLMVKSRKRGCDFFVAKCNACMIVFF